jgi:hypothetical protein
MLGRAKTTARPAPVGVGAVIVEVILNNTGRAREERIANQMTGKSWVVVRERGRMR